MIKYPDYDRSILSIASSLLKHFGVTDCQHKTLPEFDKLLEKNYKNVIVILLDGLGTSTLNYHLKDTDFCKKRLPWNIFIVLILITFRGSFDI